LSQPVPGVYLWRTPHGYWYRVDADGTHALGKNPNPTPDQTTPDQTTPDQTTPDQTTPPATPDQTTPPATPARTTILTTPRTPMEHAFADLISTH
ncbi:MAG: hypothetical protein QOF53_3566, partial [Nocardioidaceae bacterium]|nr:hypothetical protein [Nocardioidaceae bacterium]